MLHKKLIGRITRRCLLAAVPVLAGTTAAGAQPFTPHSPQVQRQAFDRAVGRIAWEHAWRDGVHAATQQHLPLVALFTSARADVPGTFQNQMGRVMNSPEIGRLAGRAIFAEVRVDSDDDGLRATENMKIDGVPTVCVLKPLGDGVVEIERWEGNFTAEQMLPDLHAAIVKAAPHAAGTVAEALEQFRDAASFGDARTVDALLPEPYATAQKAADELSNDIDEAHRELMSAMRQRFGAPAIAEEGPTRAFGSSELVTQVAQLRGEQRRDVLQRVESVRILDQRPTGNGEWEAKVEILARVDGLANPQSLVMPFRAVSTKEGWKIVSQMMEEDYAIRTVSDAQRLADERLSGPRAVLAAYQRCTAAVKAGTYSSRGEVNRVMAKAYQQSLGEPQQVAMAR
jgi:hypothetical protein